jgi:hypothetical protein
MVLRRVTRGGSELVMLSRGVSQLWCVVLDSPIPIRELTILRSSLLKHGKHHKARQHRLVRRTCGASTAQDVISYSYRDLDRKKPVWQHDMVWRATLHVTGHGLSFVEFVGEGGWAATPPPWTSSHYTWSWHGSRALGHRPWIPPAPMSVSSPPLARHLTCWCCRSPGAVVKGGRLRFVYGGTSPNIPVQPTMKINCQLKLSIMGYVFCASDYNKMWCSLQKQTHVVVLCKNVTNMWCYLLFPLINTSSMLSPPSLVYLLYVFVFLCVRVCHCRGI